MNWRDWLLLALTVALVVLALYIVVILPAFTLAGSVLR